MKQTIFMVMVITAFLLIAGCTTQQAEDGQVDPSGTDAPRICTKEYMPVCGIDGVTYSNKCMAGDIEIAYEGVCKTAEETEGRTYCTEEQKQAVACTMEYAPVCGNDNKTYGNKCGACAAGVEYWINGEC